ncbi:MAG: EF-Tu/IF-2/RF-3 family GTPase, partial [Bryobacteraceae bacterium]
TKADLAGDELVGLVRLEIEEFVAGSFLEGAPVVAVSSVTGQGIDELRRELERAAAGIDAKDAALHFRLPIDRAFSMKGFGTVVTGTLISGAVSKDQELVVLPAGRRVRVRGLQVHGEPAARAIAGQRAALNLADIDTAALARGMVLAPPEVFRPTRDFECRLALLRSAKPLKHRAPVHFHTGTAEIEAEVRLLAGQSALDPGQSAFARIVLREPALLLPGDRFIIRRFSPVITIGGGVVLDTVSRRDPARLAALDGADAAARVGLLVGESPFGLGCAELVARTGLVEARIDALARRPDFVVLRQPETWLIGASRFAGETARIEHAVAEFHRASPLLPGLAKADLRAGRPPFVLDALLASSKRLVVEGDTVRLATHRLVLREDEELARGVIERAFEHAGLAVPGVAEVLGKSGVEERRARSILQILIRERRLVRVSEELVFHAAAIDHLRSLLATRRAERFSVPVFKEWTGVSRKYAIPLL